MDQLTQDTTQPYNTTTQESAGRITGEEDRPSYPFEDLSDDSTHLTNPETFPMEELRRRRTDYFDNAQASQDVFINNLFDSPTITSYYNTVYDGLINMHFHFISLFNTVVNDLLNHYTTITNIFMGSYDLFSDVVICFTTLLSTILINISNPDFISVPSTFIKEIQEIGVIIQGMTLILAIGLLFYTVGIVLEMGSDKSSEGENKSDSEFTGIVSLLITLVKIIGTLCFLVTGFMLVYLCSYTLLVTT